MINTQSINQLILFLVINNNLIPEIKLLINKSKKPQYFIQELRCFENNFHDEENFNDILLALNSLPKELDTSCQTDARGT